MEFRNTVSICGSYLIFVENNIFEIFLGLLEIIFVCVCVCMVYLYVNTTQSVYAQKFISLLPDKKNSDGSNSTLKCLRTVDGKGVSVFVFPWSDAI